MTREQAYFEAMQPFADAVRAYYMGERLLRVVEHPDGSVRVVVHETAVFERAADGTLWSGLSLCGLACWRALPRPGLQ